MDFTTAHILGTLSKSEESLLTSLHQYHSPSPLSSPHPSTTSSSSPPQPQAEDPSSHRLRTSTFATSLRPQPPLPPSASNVLAHWVVGADPAVYDWAHTSQALAKSHNLESGESQARKTGKSRHSASQAGPSSQVRTPQPIVGEARDGVQADGREYSKRQRQDTIGPSSQPAFKRAVPRQSESTKATPGSSQWTATLVTPKRKKQSGFR